MPCSSTLLRGREAHRHQPLARVEAHDDDAAAARHLAHLVEAEHEQAAARRQRGDVVEARARARTGAIGSSSGSSVMNALPAFTRDTMSCSDAMKP